MGARLNALGVAAAVFAAPTIVSCSFPGRGTNATGRAAGGIADDETEHTFGRIRGDAHDRTWSNEKNLRKRSGKDWDPDRYQNPERGGR